MARKRERITHANSVLVKLSGDPSLFFENEDHGNPFVRALGRRVRLEAQLDLLDG